jgi:hypothetical protein
MIERGDVMIRCVPGNEFLVALAVTLNTLGGPFTTFADALEAARLWVAPGRTIWVEDLDERGRPLGPPMRVS